MEKASRPPPILHRLASQSELWRTIDTAIPDRYAAGNHFEPFVSDMTAQDRLAIDLAKLFRILEYETHINKNI